VFQPDRPRAGAHQPSLVQARRSTCRSVPPTLCGLAS